MTGSLLIPNELTEPQKTDAFKHLTEEISMRLMQKMASQWTGGWWPDGYIA